MCASFLIPLGNMLGEAGAGAAEGRSQALKDQILRQQLSQSAAEFQNYQKQQAALPGALQQFFGEKGKALWALDPTGQAATKYVMGMLATGQQTALLRSQAVEARKMGDTKRADALDSMANYMDAQFKPGEAGKMSGVLEDPFKSLNEQLLAMQRGQAITSGNEGAMDEYRYGLRPTPPVSPTLPAGMPGGPAFSGASGASPEAIANSVAALKSRGYSDKQIADIVGTLSGTSGSGRTGGVATGGVAPASGGGVAPAAVGGGMPAVPTSPGLPPVTKFENMSIDQVRDAVGSKSKYVKSVAQAELKLRANKMPNAKEKQWLEQYDNAMGAAKNLEQDVLNLGRYTRGELHGYALKAVTGGWGLPQRWKDYFRDMGAVYNNLWQASKGTGNNGGMGMLHELDIHFPHGANRLFPDDPHYALDKVRGLILNPNIAPVTRQRDAILKKQWEAQHGMSTPYLAPETVEILRNAGVPGY